MLNHLRSIRLQALLSDTRTVSSVMPGKLLVSYLFTGNYHKLPLYLIFFNLRQIHSTKAPYGTVSTVQYLTVPYSILPHDVCQVST